MPWKIDENDLSAAFLEAAQEFVKHVGALIAAVEQHDGIAFRAQDPVGKAAIMVIVK